MQPSVRQTTVGAELFRWLLFSVLLSVLPLGLRWLLPTLFPGTHESRVLLGDGELLLVGVGLAAAALSDVLSARRADSFGQLVVFGGVVCLVIGAFGYGIITVTPNVDPHRVASWSMVAFAVSMLLGASGVAMKEGQ